MWPTFRQYPDDYRYLNLNMVDDASQDLSAVLSETSTFITQALSGGETVLVHCAQGVSRSGAVVVGYLMSRFGITYDAALALSQTNRDIVRPNTNFEQQLRRIGKP